MRKRSNRSKKRVERIRPRYKDNLPIVWAVTGCTCGYANKWGEITSQCWRCVIGGLPGAQETKKNRADDRKLYRKLVRKHGKKAYATRREMKELNMKQIVDSIKRRLA